MVALASDPNVMKKTGRIVIAADAAIDYKFKDIDGRCLLLSFEAEQSVSYFLSLSLRHCMYILLNCKAHRWNSLF